MQSPCAPVLTATILRKEGSHCVALGVALAGITTHVGTAYGVCRLLSRTVCGASSIPASPLVRLPSAENSVSFLPYCYAGEERADV